MRLDWFLWDNEALRHLYKVLSLCDTLEIPFESSQGAQGRTLVGPLSKAVSKDGWQQCALNKLQQWNGIAGFRLQLIWKCLVSFCSVPSDQESHDLASRSASILISCCIGFGVNIAIKTFSVGRAKSYNHSRAMAQPSLPVAPADGFGMQCWTYCAKIGLLGTLSIPVAVGSVFNVAVRVFSKQSNSRWPPCWEIPGLSSLTSHFSSKLLLRFLKPVDLVEWCFGFLKVFWWILVAHSWSHVFPSRVFRGARETMNQRVHFMHFHALQ